MRWDRHNASQCSVIYGYGGLLFSKSLLLRAWLTPSNCCWHRHQWQLLQQLLQDSCATHSIIDDHRWVRETSNIFQNYPNIWSPVESSPLMSPWSWMRGLQPTSNCWQLDLGSMTSPCCDSAQKRSLGIRQALISMFFVTSSGCKPGHQKKAALSLSEPVAKEHSFLVGFYRILLS